MGEGGEGGGGGRGGAPRPACAGAGLPRGRVASRTFFGFCSELFGKFCVKAVCDGAAESLVFSGETSVVVGFSFVVALAPASANGKAGSTRVAQCHGFDDSTTTTLAKTSIAHSARFFFGQGSPCIAASTSPRLP